MGRPSSRICLLPFLILCSSCYTTKAAFNPYSYAPASPTTSWTPPKKVASSLPKGEADTTKLPIQEEPYSLAELVDVALCNNTMTRITWAEARAAAAQYGQSQQHLFPQLTASFNYERVRTPAFSTSLTPGGSPVAINLFSSSTLNGQTSQTIYYSDWGPQIQLSYLIFDFGALRATTESYRQALYNADWNHNSAIQQLLQTILNDFYQYVYQKQLYAAYEKDVETAQLVLDSAETGFRAGVRDVSDVLHARTQLLQNQTNYAAQQQNVEVASAQLLTDMGLPANTPLKTQDLPGLPPNDDFLPPLDDLITLALQNRPDLLASEASLRSSAESLRATKRDFLPKLVYNFDIGKTYFSGGLNDKYDFDSIFSLTMPIFTGFSHRNAIKQARANKKKAEEQLKSTELDVIQGVTTSYTNVKVSFDTVHFAACYLAAAEEEYKVSLYKYREGTNTILDVSSAQTSFSTAQASYVNSLQQWFSSLANLAYSTGLISPTHLPTTTAEEILITPEES